MTKKTSDTQEESTLKNNKSADSVIAEESEGIGLSELFSRLTEKQKHLLIRILEITLSVAAVVLIVACIFMLLSDGATVKARVNCPDWNSNASKTEIAIYNIDAKDLLTDDNPSNDPQPKIVSRIQPNEDKVLNDIISGGTYTVAVYTTPVLEDGTTFKTPEPQVLSYEGENVELVFDLEKE